MERMSTSTREAKQPPLDRSSDASAPVNPVKLFEDAAQQIWTSMRSVDDKSKRLRSLSNAINLYVARLENHLDTYPVDRWTALSLNRTRLYLSQLAEDVKKLADNPTIQIHSS
jgi:hypothetical protein